MKTHHALLLVSSFALTATLLACTADDSEPHASQQSAAKTSPPSGPGDVSALLDGIERRCNKHDPERCPPECVVDRSLAGESCVHPNPCGELTIGQCERADRCVVVHTAWGHEECRRAGK